MVALSSAEESFPAVRSDSLEEPMVPLSSEESPLRVRCGASAAAEEILAPGCRQATHFVQGHTTQVQRLRLDSLEEL